MKRRAVVTAWCLVFSASACRWWQRSAAESAHGDDSGWAVTAWGARHEIFAETGGLVAGQAVVSHAHVTVLADFSPLTVGAVSAVLRSADGREERFRQTQPKRDGIFPVTIEPAVEGTFELRFVVESGGVTEEIAAGRVSVGRAGTPGGLLASDEAPDGDVPFLKEQQWRTAFATERLEEGALHEGLVGPARVAPARGGAVVLTASVDAVVAPESWPHVGLDVAPGAAVFRLHPRTAERSLPELTADVATLEADAEVARKRVDRLAELLRVEAASAAELERAQAVLAAAAARLAAARHSIAAVSGGAAGDQTVVVRAPWAGRVAEVSVSPGQVVAAGAVLGRLVKPRPLWIDVALRPEQAPLLRGRPTGLILRRAAQAEPLEIDGGDVRLIALAPEIDARTATLGATLEVQRDASELPIGSALEAEIVLAGERRGIVVPQTALIDDAGVTVAYVQDTGESFTRREVHILAREGGRVLVDGLRAGERLVTRGGAAIRRASLLSSGAPEGHVH